MSRGHPIQNLNDWGWRCSFSILGNNNEVTGMGQDGEKPPQEINTLGGWHVLGRH